MGVCRRILVAVTIAGIAAGLAGGPWGDGGAVGSGFKVAAAPQKAVAGGLSASEVQATLDAHNAWRTKYGVPPLVWDTKLAAFAQQWADTRAKTGAGHRPNTPYGENIFWAGGSAPTPKFVVDGWGGEVTSYDLATDTCQPTKVCLHFTQLVWKTTTKVGCGMASSTTPPVGVTWSGKDVYWVCNYTPRGNVVGRTFHSG